MESTLPFALQSPCSLICPSSPLSLSFLRACSGVSPLTWGTLTEAVGDGDGDGDGDGEGDGLGDGLGDEVLAGVTVWMGIGRPSITRWAALAFSPCFKGGRSTFRKARACSAALRGSTGARATAR